MDNKKELEELRNNINNVDADILKLLAERRKLSEDVVSTKEKFDQPIRDTDRETELLLRAINAGKEFGLDAHYVSKIFYDIIDDSVRVQQKHFQSSFFDTGSDVIRIAIQGIKGSYSSMAAEQFFALGQLEPWAGCF